jgi:two-component system, NtrC family, sensor kinase
MPDIEKSDHPRVVIDDDALMGAFIDDVLQDYRITFCQSAMGALGRIQAGGSFTAIVGDLFLPGMSGFQFHAELVRIAPDLSKRVVFLTASPDGSEVKAFAKTAGVHCVAKPFTAQKLRAAVEEASRR